MLALLKLFKTPSRNIVKKRAEVYVLKDGKVWVGKDQNGMYNIPGGHLHKDENPKDAAKRECLEEIGIVPINMKFFKEIQYSNAIRNIINYSYTADFGGQDGSLYGSLKDSFDPKLVEIDTVIENLNKHAYNRYWTANTIDCLEMLKK